MIQHQNYVPFYFGSHGFDLSIILRFLVYLNLQVEQKWSAEQF